MGVYVNLDIDPGQVLAKDWQRVYDDTLRLFQSHPSEILGLGEREVCGQALLVYTRGLEKVWDGRRAYTVVGDGQSLRFGESFRMPRELLELPHANDRLGARSSGGDIVLEDPEEGYGTRVFGEKTQREPFHIPVLAAAMVAETALAPAAVVSGDIDELEAREARRCVRELLGRRVSIPVLLDAPALLDRLSARFTGPALVDALLHRFIGEQSRGLAAALRGVGGADARKWTRAAVARRGAEWQWQPAMVVSAWLAATGDIAGLCRVACLGVAPPLSPKTLAREIAGSGALLSPTLRRRAVRLLRAPLPDHELGALIARESLWSLKVLEAPHTGLGPLEAGLSLAFPGRGSELTAVARAAGAEIDAVVGRICDLIDEAAERQQRAPERGLELGELARVRDAADLTSQGRRQLAVFVRALSERCRAARSGRPSLDDQLSGLGAARARRLLALRLAEAGPTLTGRAWDWIERERDREVLGFLVRLGVFQPGREEGLLLRRALFESRGLSRVAVEMAADEALMAQAAAWIEDATREARGRTTAPRRSPPRRRASRTPSGGRRAT